MNVERRTVLQIGGLMAVGGVVAACGSSGAESTITPAASAAGSAAAGSAAAGGAGAVASTADIPVGGGVIVAEPAIVVTQPTAGEFKAFSAICTHAGCIVSKVENNEIICPCHGSKFSGTDGSVLVGPATTPLAAAGVAVEGGSVVLTG